MLGSGYWILDTGRSVAEIPTCREYWILNTKFLREKSNYYYEFGQRQKVKRPNGSRIKSFYFNSGTQALRDF